MLSPEVLRAYVYASSSPTGRIDAMGLQDWPPKPAPGYECCGCDSPGSKEWRLVRADFMTLHGAKIPITQHMRDADEILRQCCMKIYTYDFHRPTENETRKLLDGKIVITEYRRFGTWTKDEENLRKRYARQNYILLIAARALVDASQGLSPNFGESLYGVSMHGKAMAIATDEPGSAELTRVTLAHEIVHVLNTDSNHVGDTAHLMHRDSGGSRLDASDCEKLRQSPWVDKSPQLPCDKMSPR